MSWKDDVLSRLEALETIQKDIRKIAEFHELCQVCDKIVHTPERVCVRQAEEKYLGFMSGWKETVSAQFAHKSCIPGSKYDKREEQQPPAEPTEHAPGTP